MRYCIVAFCQNHGQISDVRYFRFTMTRRDSWLRALNRNVNDVVSADNSICSDHFSPEDFEMKNNKKVLKVGAVPTLKLKPSNVRRQGFEKGQVEKSIECPTESSEVNSGTKYSAEMRIFEGPSNETFQLPSTNQLIPTQDVSVQRATQLRDNNETDTVDSDTLSSVSDKSIGNKRKCDMSPSSDSEGFRGSPKKRSLSMRTMHNYNSSAMDPLAGPSGSQQPRRRKPITKEEKQVIWNVYEGLKKTSPPTEAVERCAFLTGVSMRTVDRVVREMRISGRVQAPQTHSRGRKRLELTDDQKQVIRGTVHSFYFENRIPTNAAVLMKLREKEMFPEMSLETLRKVLRELQFRYAKRCSKSILIDKPEVASWRRQYLRSIRTFRKLQRKIYYLDETRVQAGLQTPEGQEQGLFFAHIGSDSGFLDVSPLVHYDEDLSHEHFENWFEGVLQRVEQNSVIVMDNAPCHSRRLEQIPTIGTKKEGMQRWLQEKGILFFDDMIQTELMGLIRQHRNSYQQYAIDTLAFCRGIIVLRLPPYHNEFNPIELIWTQVKDHMARENATFKIGDVHRLFYTALNLIRPEDWQQAISDVLKVEDRMWKLDALVDTVLETYINGVGSRDTSDGDSSEESMDSDS